MGLEVPLGFRLRGKRRPLVSNLDDPPLPQVHAQVGGGRGRKGKGGLSSGASFLARRFPLWRGVYSFLGTGPSARARPSGRPPQPLPSGQVPREGGRETLTGLFSKATKVLSMPMLKPAEPALQEFIQQVRMPAGPRPAVCPAALAAAALRPADQSPAGDQGAELEC